MALVDGNTKDTGYGNAPAPAATYWDQQLGTYRNPVTGLVAIGSDILGWQWVTEAEYRTLSGLGMEDDFAPADMFTPSTPITDQFAHDMSTYGNPAWEDATIPNYDPGTRITPNGAIPPATNQRETRTYPSVPAPYPGSVKDINIVTPRRGISPDIEDRRKMTPPMPTPQAAPAPTPGIMVIGGQIVRVG